MNVLELLKGHKVSVKTDMKTTVELIIKEIKPEQHSRQITPDTRENDWWGETQDWTTYTVYFTNGATKTYNSLEEIDIIN